MFSYKTGQIYYLTRIIKFMCLVASKMNLRCFLILDTNGKTTVSIYYSVLSNESHQIHPSPRFFLLEIRIFSVWKDSFSTGRNRATLSLQLETHIKQGQSHWLWSLSCCLPFIHSLTLSVIISFKMSVPLIQKIRSNQPHTELRSF